jgi:putative glutamine amidotransferase
VARSTPLIGIPADRRILGPHPFHCVGEKYITAVAQASGCIPVLIPSLGADADLDGILEHVDGILLTGSPSNVEPHHYAGQASDPDTLHDPHRDATTLPLIPRVVAAGMPLFAVCRGFQEMNVAFGGSLHPEIRELPGRINHRMPRLENGEIHPDLEVVFADRHEVRLVPGGAFAGIFGCETIRVNSLHGQGILDPGVRVVVEGVAGDGTIEAIRIADAPGFALGVQWHAEYDPQSNRVNQALFEAFGAALRDGG